MTKSSIKATEDQTIEQIANLRNVALKLIQENDRWERVGNTPVMHVKNHRKLSIVYMTPFPRAQNSPQQLGYALEICEGRRVVLSLVWDSNCIFIETFRPGAWEIKLDEPAITANLAA